MPLTVSPSPALLDLAPPKPDGGGGGDLFAPLIAGLLASAGGKIVPPAGQPSPGAGVAGITLDAPTIAAPPQTGVDPPGRPTGVSGPWVRPAAGGTAQATLPTLSLPATAPFQAQPDGTSEPGETVAVAPKPMAIPVLRPSVTQPALPVATPRETSDRSAAPQYDGRVTPERSLPKRIVGAPSIKTNEDDAPVDDPSGHDDSEPASAVASVDVAPASAPVPPIAAAPAAVATPSPVACGENPPAETSVARPIATSRTQRSSPVGRAPPERELVDVDFKGSPTLADQRPPSGTDAGTPVRVPSPDLSPRPMPTERQARLEAAAGPALGFEALPAITAAPEARGPTPPVTVVASTAMPTLPNVVAASVARATPEHTAPTREAPEAPVSAMPARGGAVSPAPVPRQPAPIILPALQAFGAAMRRALADDRKPARLADDTAAGVPTLAATTSVITPAAAPSATLDTADRRWPHAMAAQIERLRDDADASSTRIRLLPDALGPVDVSVRREGDTVHVHFTAATAETRQLLADAQPRLADAAEARGVRLGRTEVSGGDVAGGQDRRERTPAPPAQPLRPAVARAAAATADPTDARIA